MTPKEPKRVRPDGTVLLKLSNRERDMILEHSFADEDLIGRLRIVPRRNQAAVVSFTLDELDDLADDVAAEANHAKTHKLRDEWDRLYDRLATTLELYTVEDD